VELDRSSCGRHLSYGIRAPGTLALQLFTNHDSLDEAVQRFGLSNYKMPIAGSPGWSVHYEQTKGNFEGFGIHFAPFDGNTFNRDNFIYVGSGYGYYDQDSKTQAHYKPSNSPLVQKNQFASSASTFKSTVIADLEGLRSEVIRVIDAKDCFASSTKPEALAKINNDIDRRIELMEQHSETLYGLMIEQFAIDECE